MDRDLLTVFGALAAFFWMLGEWLCALFRAGREDHRPGRFATAILSSVPVWFFLAKGFDELPWPDRAVLAVGVTGVYAAIYLGDSIANRMRSFGFDRLVKDIPGFEPTVRPLWSAFVLLLLAALACFAVFSVVS